MSSGEPKDVHSSSPCPKRLWVQLTLSDDELLEKGGELPQGLRFHVSKCEPCRELADRMTAVTGGLDALAERTPPDDLSERANQRTLDALRAGAPLTGRIEIALVAEDSPAEDPAIGRKPWWLPGRYAAAAAVLLVVGLWSVTQLARTRTLPGDDPPNNAVDQVVDGVTDGRLAADGGGDASSGEDVPPAVQPQVDNSQRRTVSRHRVRRHHTHLEAASADDPGGVQSAVVLPDPTKRGLSWPSLIDILPPVRSTTPSAD